jgi:hypothetical protein
VKPPARPDRQEGSRVIYEGSRVIYKVGAFNGMKLTAMPELASQEHANNCGLEIYINIAIN